MGDKLWDFWLDKIISELRPNLVILDSMIRFFDGDENSSKDVKKIYDSIKPLRDKYKTASDWDSVRRGRAVR